MNNEDFEIVLAKSGRRFTVGKDQTILGVLDQAGIHVARSCAEGSCGTCVTKVIEGTPDHRDTFLMGRKRAGNTLICVCCSRSLTPALTLDL